MLQFIPFSPHQPYFHIIVFFVIFRKYFVSKNFCQVQIIPTFFTVLCRMRFLLNKIDIISI